MSQPRSSEKAFLERYDPEQFDRPSVTVDVVLLTVRDESLRCLLFRRAEHPHRSRWALPGGFVGIGESLDEAAARVLREKAGLRDLYIEQLYTFGEPKRDPRARIISVAYYGLVPEQRLSSANDGVLARLEEGASGSVRLVDAAGRSLQTAFDHGGIVAAAQARLRGKVDYAPVGFELLPATFPLRDLQRVHEAILGKAVNKDSFRRRMLATGLLEATGDLEERVGHRPAQSYRFAGRNA